MKNNDLQELKPVYIHEASYSAGDEISLIDLAIVLVKRKTIIAVIFTLITALGVTVALFKQKTKTYTFSTTIEIGSQIIDGTIIPFETPQALLAKLQYSYIPQMLSEHKQSYPDDKRRYQIKPSVPSGSNITLLEIKGTEDQTDTLKGLLQIISQKAIQDHSRIFQSVKASIETRINQATNNLKSLKNINNNESKIASNQNDIESLTSQLANLRNTREILPPIMSLDPNPTGRSRKIIVIISAFAGIFLGVFSAFFTEFLSKVKREIDKNKI